MSQIIDGQKVLTAMWYSPLNMSMSKEPTIGIVAVRDTLTGKSKVYIGNCSGENLESDIEKIVKSGAKFYPESVKIILDVIEKGKK